MTTFFNSISTNSNHAKLNSVPFLFY